MARASEVFEVPGDRPRGEVAPQAPAPAKRRPPKAASVLPEAPAEPVAAAAPRRLAPRYERELRGAYSIWQRELIRFFRERVRAVTQFVQPLLYLFVFGTGLGAAVRRSAVGGTNFRIFLLPGVIVMTTMFTSMFAAVSIVWDREFGFLKEILVAPISRTSVILAKSAGGSTTSAIQGLAILLLAPLVGLHPSVIRVMEVIVPLIVFALAVNAMGAALAGRVQSMQGFMVIMNFATLPLYFMSGAVFPLTTAPEWLRVVALFDPVSYAVDAIRRTLIPHYPPSVHWAGHAIPIPAEVLILAGFATVMFALAVRAFENQP